MMKLIMRLLLGEQILKKETIFVIGCVYIKTQIL